MCVEFHLQVPECGEPVWLVGVFGLAHFHCLVYILDGIFFSGLQVDAKVLRSLV